MRSLGGLTGACQSFASGALLARCTSWSLVPPWAIQSDTSPFSFRFGSSRMRISAAVAPSCSVITLAWFCPASSLSGNTMILRPAKCKFNSWVHFLAPPELQDASNPSCFRASTSFSPSTRKIVFLGCSRMAGRLYGKGVTPCRFHTCLPFSRRLCRKSFGSNRITS